MSAAWSAPSSATTPRRNSQTRSTTPPTAAARTAPTMPQSPLKNGRRRARNVSASAWVFRIGFSVVSRSECVTTTCFHRPMELTDFAESLEALVALGRGELRRRCLDRGTAPHVVSFRVLRHRGDGGLRGGRGVGGRRGQDGGLVDLVALSGAAGGGQAPGASRADACATCPRWPQAWRDGVHRRSTRPRPSPRPGGTAPRPPWPVTRRCWWPRPPRLGFEDFSRALSYWKQLADPDGAEAADEERKASRNVFLESSFSRHVAGPDDARPDLRARSWRTSSTAWSTTSSRPTVPRPRSAGPHGRGSTSWPAPRASAGPTPWSRWPRAAAAPRPRASAPPRSSASSSATRPCTAASVSSRTARCSHPRPSTPWMDSAYFERAIFSLGQPHRRQRAGPALHRGTRRAIELRDRICTHPHCYEPAENCQVDHIETYAAGRRDHPGERPVALRLPQPPAQPSKSAEREPSASARPPSAA